MTLPPGGNATAWARIAALLRRADPAMSEPGHAHRIAGFIDRTGDASGVRANPVHVTASCLVVSPDFDRVLLTLHRKARQWLQFGGHLEAGDASVLEAAVREAREESGVQGLEPAVDLPVSASIHELPESFGTCRIHADIMYAAVLDPAEPIAASPESLEIGWHRLDALPEETAPDIVRRLPGILPRIRSTLGRSGTS